MQFVAKYRKVTQDSRYYLYVSNYCRIFAGLITDYTK